MLGIGLFAVLIVLFVALDKALDRGTRERWLARRDYASYLSLMSFMEQGGAELYDVDNVAGASRRIALTTVIQPAVIALVTLMLQAVIGFDAWIAATVLSGYVFLTSLGLWLGLENAYGDPEGRRGSGERKWEFFGLAAKAAIAFAGVLAVCRSMSEVSDGHWPAGVAWSIVGLLLVTYCYLPATWAERVARRHRAVAFAECTDRQAVLLLRSFADDNFTLFTPMAGVGPRFRFVPRRQRIEEFIVTLLSGTAGLVAIGRPGERTAALGASRTYWTDDTWKEAVSHTASRALALIVMAGNTPNLAWEISHIAERGLLPKALILLPPDSVEGTVARYNFICGALEVSESKRLSDDALQYMLLGLRFDEALAPVHYMSCGRDWAAYSAALSQFIGSVRGELRVHASRTTTERTAQVLDPVTTKDTPTERIATHNVVRLPRGRGAATYGRAIYIARAALDGGDSHEALVQAEKAYEAALEIGVGTAVADALVIMGDALVALDRANEALRPLRQAVNMRNLDTLRLTVFQAFREPTQILARAYELLAECGRRRADPDQIEEALRGLRKFRLATGSRAGAADAAMLLARHFVWRNEEMQARGWAATARTEFESLGRVVDAREAAALVKDGA